jgi:hypothetical protein
MNRTKKLQIALKKAIADLGTTPNAIKEGRYKNPFPVGTKTVESFANRGKASDSAKWKLLEYLEKL